MAARTDYFLARRPGDTGLHGRSPESRGIFLNVLCALRCCRLPIAGNENEDVRHDFLVRSRKPMTMRQFMRTACAEVCMASTGARTQG